MERHDSIYPQARSLSENFTNPTSANKFTQNQQIASYQTPKWIVILLLIIFPPASWYIMCKEKIYHRWFPVIIIIYSCSILLTTGSIMFLVLPNMLKLYENLELPNPIDLYIYPTILTVTVFAIMQAFFSIYIKKYIDNNGVLSMNLLIITIIFLILNYLFYSFTPAVLSMLMMNPIYTLVN